MTRKSMAFSSGKAIARVLGGKVTAGLVAIGMSIRDRVKRDITPVVNLLDKQTHGGGCQKILQIDQTTQQELRLQLPDHRCID